MCELTTWILFMQLKKCTFSLLQKLTVKEINEGELLNKPAVLEFETAQKTGESQRRKLGLGGVYFDTNCLEQTKRNDYQIVKTMNSVF